MGIFRHDLTRPGRVPETVWDDKPCVSVDLRAPCDRCRVAQAQVEVVTDAGPILCQHHYQEHRDAIVAVGHLIRAWRPGSGPCS
jgi:hypothetical protein